MKNLEEKIIKKLSQYDSITIGYMHRNVDNTLEIGFTSYIDNDFVTDLYLLLGQVLFDYKTQTVGITIVDVDDGDKNPLDAVVNIKL